MDDFKSKVIDYNENILQNNVPIGEFSENVLEKMRDAVSKNNSVFSEEFQFIISENKKIDVILFAVEVFYNNKKSILLILQDITSEKVKNELLKEAAKKEKEASAIKDRFFINMSHEIRTPMNAIIGFSQLALMKNQTSENKDLFNKISSSSKNLLTIINDILDFSKIESDKLELHSENFYLEDIIANAFMVCSPRIGEKKVEMLLNMNNEVPNELFGDKTRLWQILKNLLDNSAKYIKEGTIILRVKLSDEQLEEEKVFVEFEIEDTGFGMSKPQLEKLFVPFEQFHNKTKNITTGTGLGMSITKELVELMGGKLDVISFVDVGTKLL